MDFSRNKRCVCGKVSFKSSVCANRAVDLYHATWPSHTMNAYECDDSPGTWHIGHLKENNYEP